MEVPLRTAVRERLEREFGPPAKEACSQGVVWRWTLARPGRHGHTMHVSILSPEFNAFVHVLISDPGSGRFAPVSSLLLRTGLDLEALVERVRLQWGPGGAGPGASGGDGGAIRGGAAPPPPDD